MELENLFHETQETSTSLAAVLMMMFLMGTLGWLLEDRDFGDNTTI